MSARPTSAVLNELAASHNRTLAKYLGYASPWLSGRDAKATQTLKQVMVDHAYLAERFSKLVTEAGLPVDPGHFPMAYTGWHDLGVKFLLSRLIEDERQRCLLIERCLLELNLAPYAKAIAEEALGMSKGHLESFEELQSGATAA